MKNILKVHSRNSSFLKTLQFIIAIIFLTFIGACTNSKKTEKTVEEISTDWIFQSQREAIAPTHWVDANVKFNDIPTLALSGDNKVSSNGSWSYTYDVIPNDYYKFITNFKPENITQIDRSVLAQITWLSQDGKKVEYIEFPGTEAKPVENNWFRIQQTYQVPIGAVKAKIDLIYRWCAEGTVYFGGASFEKTNATPTRKVRLATIYHKPINTSSPQENLEQFKKYIDIAGQQKSDFVCLPEGITVVGTEKSYIEVSESIPGPTTKYLGKLAKEHNMYIIAGIYEKVGQVVYNSSVLIGRNGQLQGKYRKASLPREEIDGGITPGENFPVFDTDFGKVGMMICWDSQFPEAARMLTFQGAEIVFLPIWGGNLTLVKARAIENEIFVVSSSYDMKTGVFNKKGELLVEGTIENPVAIVEVDLNKRNLSPWLGEFKNRIKRELPIAKAIKY